MHPYTLPPHVRRRIASRNRTVRSKGFADYDAYLASGVWGAVKARYRASDHPQQCMCGATEVQIHHQTYERVGGDELLGDLLPLCRTCHQLVHILERRNEIGLDLAGFYNNVRAARHRANRARLEVTHEMKREAFHALTPAERIRRLLAATTERRGLIAREVKVIGMMLNQAKTRPVAPRLDRQIRRTEERLTAHRPAFLDEMTADLMPSKPKG